MEKVQRGEFSAIYKIMCDSFPPSERRTHDGQAALFLKDIYSVYAMRDEYGDILAFAAVYFLGEYLFVEHLAVQKQYRGMGLGTVMLDRLKSLSPSGKLCLEVEEPITEIARRRVGFYERSDFVFNDYMYIQPSLQEGEKPLSLKLMTYPDAMSFLDFERTKGKIYKEVYNKI